MLNFYRALFLCLSLVLPSCGMRKKDKKTLDYDSGRRHADENPTDGPDGGGNPLPTGGNQKPGENNKLTLDPALVGDWKTECISDEDNYARSDVSFNANNTSRAKIEFFTKNEDNEPCDRKFITIEVESFYSANKPSGINDQVKNIDYKLAKVYMTLNSRLEVRNANAKEPHGRCDIKLKPIDGDSEWTKDTKYDITGRKNCGKDGTESADAGTASYDIYQVEEDKLSMGLKIVEDNRDLGRSPEHRPNEFNGYIFNKLR